MSPGDVGVLLSFSVSPMVILHEDVVVRGMDIPGHGFHDSYEFSRKSSTPGEMCALELDSMTGMDFPGRAFRRARVARKNRTI